jgi:hypothetical protein
MTTTANAFLANGPAAIGVEARPSFAPHWFKFGALAVGHTAGVFGATNDIVAIPPSNLTGIGVWGVSKWNYGVLGQSLITGIRGEGSTGPGVEAFSSNNSGVSAAAGAWPSTLPPAGFDWQAGVSGQSQDHPAVTGFSTNNYAFQGFSTNSTGILGITGANGPTPVLVNLAGVVGSSDQQVGIIGTSNLIGVYGYCGNADPMKPGIGVYGYADPAEPNNYAGAFKGNVSVNGTLTASVKNAMVPFPDGTQRVLHCMESPEHWFEDFGAAKLKRGRKIVKLDANFAKVIKRGDYKVFVTPEGECGGLYVRKSPASFEVREFGGGTSSVAFSYRIVGRRKDIRGHQRFAKIEIKLPVFPRPRRPARGKRLARNRKQTGALSGLGRRRRRGKRRDADTAAGIAY